MAELKCEVNSICMEIQWQITITRLLLLKKCELENLELDRLKLTPKFDAYSRTRKCHVVLKFLNFSLAVNCKEMRDRKYIF